LLGIDSTPCSLTICRNRSPWCLPARAILPTLMLNFPIARAILPALVLDSVLSSIASSPPPQPLSHRGDHRPGLLDSVPSRSSPPPLPCHGRRRPINRRSCCLLPLGIGLFLFVVMSQHPHGEIPPYVRRGDPNCAALYSRCPIFTPHCSGVRRMGGAGLTGVALVGECDVSKPATTSPSTQQCCCCIESIPRCVLW